ncbi:MAG: hypothetical protein KA746_09645 [Pyrinomonadaceae bacterium]|nr:hypothetical protein [Pyrinomonadaceae bacterium]MBP6212712.1 hypothetical protein [Pyrinomonadaceae bacterium]
MNELDNLAKELFQKFSRFEYALKAAGFHTGEGEAKADWRNFALSIEKDLANPEGNLKAAIEYILTQPPRKQVIRNGLLEWDPSAPTTNSQADLILLYIRRIRNNLFHGGKFNGHWFDPPRSAELLRSSLTVLDACLEASTDVRVAFYD